MTTSKTTSLETYEADVERYFVQRVEAAGGFAPKCVFPGTAGAPDRLVFWPHLPTFHVHMVELKRPGGRKGAAQKALHTKFNELGKYVFVIHTKYAVERYMGIVFTPEALV